MNSMPSFSGPPTNNNTFAKSAALVCLISPFALIALTYGFQHVSHVLSGHNLAVATLVVGAVSCILLVVGSILGILALLLMKPGGRGLIVSCSLIGLTCCGLLVAIAVPNFVRARSRALSQNSAIDNLISAAKDFKKQSADSLKTNGQAASLARINQALDQTARSSSGDDALVARGTQAFLARVQAIQGAYQIASENLTAADVLSTSNLVDRDTIQERKALVQNFLKCNQDLKNFVDRNEENYRAELERLNVSPAVIAAGLKSFHSRSAPQIPFIDEIRADDERKGHGMLAILDLLDANWGRWNYNAQDGHVRFETAEMVQQYNTDLGGIRDASTEQAGTQKHLAEVLGQLSMR